jgi:hypothetical protein
VPIESLNGLTPIAEVIETKKLQKKKDRKNAFLE